MRERMKIVQYGDTYIAPPGSFFDGNVRIDGNLILPPETHIWGRLVVGGRLEMGPGSTVGNDVECDRAVIGDHVRIKGTLTAAAGVTVCDHARIRAIRAGGDIILRDGVQAGDVHSDQTIYVYGKVASDRLIGRNVKVHGT
ncbi:MAG: polymer-forming cytoskeletal protein [Methanomicrobiales archaeon]